MTKSLGNVSLLRILAVQAQDDGGVTIVDPSGGGQIVGEVVMSGGEPAVNAVGASRDLNFGAGGATRAQVRANGALKFVPLAADPENGQQGDVYFNGTTNRLRQHNGMAWVDLVGPPPEPLVVSLGPVTSLLPTSFTLSMNIVSGAAPANSSMRLEWTDNFSSGPWRLSTPVAASGGSHSHAFQNAPAGTTLFRRGVVFSVSPSGLETIDATTEITAFTTPSEGGGTLTLENGTPTGVTATGFTLSATVGGTIPAGAVTLIQWTDNPNAGPWRESARTPSVPGSFSHTFTGAPSSTTIYWRAFVFTEPSTIHAQSPTITFSTPASAQGNWVQLLQDSMAVQDVSERFTSGENYNRIIGSDGSPVPFPDSYAGFVSQAGISAAFVGRSTGQSELTTWPGRPDSPLLSPNIRHFPDGFDAAAVWSWWSTKQGHNAPNSRLRVSDMFLSIFRESTRTWQTLFTGMRVSGVRYYSLFGQPVYGAGENLSEDPNATYLTMPNGFNIEAWCAPTVSNPGNHVPFFGAVNRAVYADSRSWCIGVKVRVEGSDRANARFIGTVGLDHHRSDAFGDASRSWPSGFPAYVSDSGGGEWKNIRNDGQDQWVVAIGCFEISRFQGIRPPWGNWSGAWAFSSAPNYGPTWPEIAANPPPDFRV
jgi:hypothetical protein